MKPSDKILKKAAQYLKNPLRLKKLAQQAFEKSPRINEQAAKKPGVTDSFKRDFKSLIDITKAYYKGQYRNIPWKSISMIVGSLLYFVAIIDVVPDFILGVGLVDDISVILWTLKYVQEDLKDFRAWQSRQENPTVSQTIKS